ncbi:MAG: YggS family pyridoxal phosphate-dependent enzyme [Gammaproteobacteria bacterium]|nr:YggS family pyridoxal phosphate-dependent enzyme [Gammaproteobacteria bacterium]
MTNTRKQFIHINQRIEDAFQKSGRSHTQPVTLLAVSKYHSVQKIHDFYELGQRDFGESYLQEALQKIEANTHKDIIWHFIGPIQSNKTKLIAKNFHWVHSVDRFKIAQRLNTQRAENSNPLNICLQINISQETQKSGFSQDEVTACITEISQLPHLSLRGLMAIPKASNNIEQQKQAFHQLKQLMLQLNQHFNLTMDTLSMGMSNDLDTAITEGATIIRIGTALFGARKKIID